MELAIGITAAAIVLLTGITVGILLYFGLINSHHPMKKPRGNQIRVACVGDSITYGCMVANRGKNNYPAVLNGLLGDNYCVNNFGYTNRTAIKSADYPFVNERTYKQSLDFKPNVVIILLGSNDSKKNNWNKDKFVNDYGEIIDSYLSLDSSPKVYVLVPPPAFEVRGKVLYQIRDDVIDNEICPTVKSLAQSKGLEFIDLHSIFEGKKDLFADGVHPNAEGCKLLAQSVFEAIKDNNN